MRKERNTKGVRVIVCGGRDFKDDPMLSHVLWHVHCRRSIAELIHGGQRGADQMANRWAFEHGIHRTEIRAEWRKYGQTKAPLIRNRMMLELQPDGLIAFTPGSFNSVHQKIARHRLIQLRGAG